MILVIHNQNPPQVLILYQLHYFSKALKFIKDFQFQFQFLYFQSYYLVKAKHLSLFLNSQVPFCILFHVNLLAFLILFLVKFTLKDLKLSTYVVCNWTYNLGFIPMSKILI